MKLNKKQAKLLNEIAEIIKASHQEEELYGDEAYHGDSTESIMDHVEELIFELGIIDRKIF